MNSNRTSRTNGGTARSGRAIGGAIVDLDGTVYRGERPIGGARDGIESIRAAGVDVLFLTNKPVERRRTYVDALRAAGIDVSRPAVVTSAVITADYLAATHADDPIYVVGEAPLVDELSEAGLEVTSTPAEAGVVLASMDRSFEYGVLEDVLEAFENEPAFYATNPDRTCPVEGGEIPDAGAMIGAIEGLVGRELDAVLGKPSPIAVETASERLGVPPEECLVVGDRLETDIEMGARAGMTTALVLSGVSSREDLERAAVTPDYVLEDLSELASVIDR
ncbi:HAD-IIA family hydrolase [Natrononativus amylolyticus]|uniref:HAD-IIA family hydrolase n=1 Tax=Natrononativus amylolyticus TaxID=2963434 RepID=UPI0020CED4B9|nr:HAD-IIA family hydrolase [Natrononativus amylolyticus]